MDPELLLNSIGRKWHERERESHQEVSVESGIIIARVNREISVPFEKSMPSSDSQCMIAIPSGSLGYELVLKHRLLSYHVVRHRID